ncbi:Mitochondrial pyruvate carrier 4 [Castilleja foliolosa]|uniref:Mitochondrial pyruvate carrier n=1 Tax=Castilleja foliolosa TaxID=1961234 RepID=A0ABD3CC64_9LAMI
MASKLHALWNHPAGPKTSHLKDKISNGELVKLGEIQVHFWAPTFKWGISIANLADSTKPPEKVSYPQQIAVTATGVIWSRYSTVITPKNWNLFSVNVVMAGTGIYQLTRKIRHDYFNEDQAVVAKE